MKLMRNMWLEWGLLISNALNKTRVMATHFAKAVETEDFRLLVRKIGRQYSSKKRHCFSSKIELGMQSLFSETESANTYPYTLPLSYVLF
jgi:hypothetical protein